MPSFTITQDPLDKLPARTFSRYPFRTMAVGECAVFDQHEPYKRLSNSAHMTGSRHGMKFTVRRCNDERIRVWRIA